jgi:hypothetical protein
VTCAHPEFLSYFKRKHSLTEEQARKIIKEAEQLPREG